MSDSVATASPPQKAATKKVAKPKKPAVHPKYNEMVAAAVAGLKERGGSSRQAILKYILKNFTVGTENEKIVNSHVKMALRAGVKNDALKQSKGSGAQGSFRLGEVKKAAAPKKAKKPKAAKPKKVVKPKSPKKAKSPAKKAVKQPTKEKTTTKTAKPKVKKATKPKSPAKKAAKPAAAKKAAKPVAKKATKPTAKKAAATPKKAAKKTA